MNKLLHHKDDDIFSTSWYTVWQYNKRGLATMKHKYCKLPHLSKGKSFICCLKTYLLSNVLNSRYAHTVRYKNIFQTVRILDMSVAGSD